MRVARRILFLAVIAGAGIAGWRYWQTTRPTGTVTARIVLDRGICRFAAHSATCGRLAHGGTLVIFGPSTDSGGGPETHQVTLHSADQRVSLRLAPGSYGLGFWISPPYGALLPDFGVHGSGNFVIRADRTTDLGTVQPGPTWTITES